MVEWDFDAKVPDWMLNAMEMFVAKIPLDASYYVESLAFHLVRDAYRQMYRVPLLFPVFATLHDDFETTPEIINKNVINDDNLRRK